MEDGYIKFDCRWIKAVPVSDDKIKELNRWRDKFYSLGMVGAYENGMGFGNLSIRTEGNEFITTGSATGNESKLDGRHYSTVKSFDIDNNTLVCEGPVKASSESLSHAAIYECSEKINAVIHIHSLKMWKKLIDNIPTTNRLFAYGTPEIARDIQRLFRETDVMQKKILVMGGHEEGIISFGKDLDEAGNIMMKYFEGASPTF